MGAVFRRNKVQLSYSLLILMTGLLTTNANAALVTTDVYVGKVTTVKTGTIERVAVGNEGVVEASALDTGELLLLGLSPGVSDVFVWTTGERLRRFTVRVYQEPQEDQIGRLAPVLSIFPGVKAEQNLGVVLLTGKVDAANFERFEKAISDFGNIISLVEPELNINIEQSIVLDVRILEIGRNAQRQLGVRWSDTTAGPALGVVGTVKPNSRFGVVSATDNEGDLRDILTAVGTDSRTLSSFFGITSIFGSEIDLLQEQGAARTLAEPSLSTVSGEPAEFLAGGEIPVAVLNQFGQPIIEFHEFGIKLDIEPIMDRNQNIRARIGARISSVDFSTVVNGVPGFLERSTESTITARPGETIIISGLVNVDDAKNVDKVPGLGDIPVLGELFRSQGFRKQRTELIITVTPRIQTANAPIPQDFTDAHQGLKKVLESPDDLDKALLW